MCRATTCKVCGKTTWTGCGQHIASVKKNVPVGQWCDGKHTRAEMAAKNKRSGQGLFAKLFNR